MFEFFAVAIAVSGIVALARGRGASTVLSGVISVVGWAVLRYGGLFIVKSSDGVLLVMIAAWAFLGAVALYLRFVVGAKLGKPDGQWNCSNCNYLNARSSVICEACQTPYQAKADAASAS